MAELRRDHVADVLDDGAEFGGFQVRHGDGDVEVELEGVPLVELVVFIVDNTAADDAGQAEQRVASADGALIGVRGGDQFTIDAEHGVLQGNGLGDDSAVNFLGHTN